jgi:hypothetical protein
MELQGRVGSLYAMGVFGGIMLGQGLGGVIARTWGITAPFGSPSWDPACSWWRSGGS